jgi:hypothetical protein
MKGENSCLNKKPPSRAVFYYPGKKKPTADAVGKDNSGWMFTDSECVWTQTGKKTEEPSRGLRVGSFDRAERTKACSNGWF